MIYSLDSWKKLHFTVFSDGNRVVSQHFSFVTSPGAFVVGIIFLCISVLDLISFFAQNGPEPLLIIALIFIVAGAVLTIKSKIANNVRREHGGIHPDDTLIILDASHQTATKQKGNSEEHVTSFADMQLVLGYYDSRKTTKHQIDLIYPQGKVCLVSTNNRALAEKLLQEIKTILNIT